MMNGGEKSDSAIGARKPPNGAGPPAEEAGERRAEAEGNAGQFSTRRTQGRENVSHGLDRVRQAATARRNGSLRFCTLSTPNGSGTRSRRSSARPPPASTG